MVRSFTWSSELAKDILGQATAKPCSSKSARPKGAVLRIYCVSKERFHGRFPKS